MIERQKIRRTPRGAFRETITLVTTSGSRYDAQSGSVIPGQTTKTKLPASRISHTTHYNERDLDNAGTIYRLAWRNDIDAASKFEIAGSPYVVRRMAVIGDKHEIELELVSSR